MNNKNITLNQAVVMMCGGQLMHLYHKNYKRHHASIGCNRLSLRSFDLLVDLGLIKKCSKKPFHSKSYIAEYYYLTAKGKRWSGINKIAAMRKRQGLPETKKEI